MNITATREAVAILQAATAKLAEGRQVWTQGHFARDAKGRALTSGARPEAVCFCAFGLLEWAAARTTASPGARGYLGALERLEDLVEERVGLIGLAVFNDDPKRDYGEVLGLFQEAASNAASALAAAELQELGPGAPEVLAGSP